MDQGVVGVRSPMQSDRLVMRIRWTLVIGQLGECALEVHSSHHETSTFAIETT